MVRSSKTGTGLVDSDLEVTVNRRNVFRDVGRTTQTSDAAGNKPQRSPEELEEEELDVEAQRESGGGFLPPVSMPRPSLENCGFARAMMRQMPSKLALSVSKTANLAYDKSQLDVTTDGESVLNLSSRSFARLTPSLIRYEKDVVKLVDIIEPELVSQGKSILMELRKNTRLRELTVCLTVKRLVRERLERNLAQGRALRRQTRLQVVVAKLGRALVLTERFLAESHDLVHIWHNQLKNIEGNFGQNVGLYFRFMRWLLVVNVEAFVLSAIFLVTPQLVLDSTDPDEAHRSAIGMPSPSHRLAPTSRSADPFSVADLLTGRGWLLTTTMYYGHYYRDTIRTTAGGSYHMPSAYFNITTLSIVFQLVMLASSTARSYRKNFIDVSMDSGGTTANLILAGWDARVTSEQLAELKRSGLYSCFQKKLKKQEAAEEAKSAPVDEATTRLRRRQQVKTLLGRVVANLMVLAVLVGVSALTWRVMMMTSTLQSSSLSVIGSAVLIGVLMALFPLLFYLIGRMESLHQHERALMFITLFRMVLMAMIILSTIVTYWIHNVNSRQTDDKGAHTEKRCWEDEVGSEFYQLMIVDLLFALVFEIGLEYARKVCFRMGLVGVGEPHFDIPRGTMFLIYSQTLVWAGTYFSPLLSLIGSLKLVITFYARKWSLEHNCQPQSRSVRASQTQTVFRVVAFIVCFLAACFTGYIIFNVRPSKTCGPFQGLVAPWIVVNEALDTLRDQGHTFVYELLVHFHKPGVVAVWILVFSVVTYYLRSLALARQEMIELLRGQLMLEGQDKVMLLQMIDEASNKLQEVKRVRHELAEEQDRHDQLDDLIVPHSSAELHVLMEPTGPTSGAGSDETREGDDTTADGTRPARDAWRDTGLPKLKVKEQHTTATGGWFLAWIREHLSESSDDDSDRNSEVSG